MRPTLFLLCLSLSMVANAAQSTDAGWTTADTARFSAMGDVGTPILAIIAADSQTDLATRGAAIVGLGDLGTDDARMELDRLIRETDTALVKAWAGAARIQAARNAEDLLALSWLVQQVPATGRPFRDALGRVGARELVALTYTAPDNASRMAAASAAATVGAGDPDAVAGSVIATLRYTDRDAEIPWAGGALYIPSMTWSRADATTLVRELIGWYLHCSQKGDTAAAQQVWNNLWSLGLLWTSDYQGQLPLDTEGMLTRYQQVEGATAARSLRRRLGMGTEG